MNKRVARWDRFVHSLLICIITAQRQYDYFILGDLDPNNIEDLFFFRICTLAANFVKKCKIYGYVPTLWKYWKFRYKERALRTVPYEVMALFGTDKAHICSKEERAQLIKEIAEKNEVKLEEIPQLYKEYYSR